MPATGVKFTMVFRDDIAAITESHIYLSGSSPAGALAAAQDLMTARMALMGEGIEAVGGRLSQLGKPRVVALLPDSFLSGLAVTPVLYTIPSPSPAIVANQKMVNSPDAPNSAFQLNWTGANGHNGHIFMAGVPDAVISSGSEPTNIFVVPGYQALVDAYTTLLRTAGWGTVCRKNTLDTLPEFTVEAVVTDPTSLNASLIVTGNPAPIAAGKFVQVYRFTRTNVAYLSLNGRWQVYSVTAGPAVGQYTITLRGSQGVPLDVITALGFVQQWDQISVAYGALAPGRAASRKRGNRVLRPRARQSRPRRISL